MSREKRSWRRLCHCTRRSSMPQQPSGAAAISSYLISLISYIEVLVCLARTNLRLAPGRPDDQQDHCSRLPRRYLTDGRCGTGGFSSILLTLTLIYSFFTDCLPARSDPILAEESLPVASSPVSVSRDFAAAQQKYAAEPDAETAWQYARACYDAANTVANRTDRADFANRGIQACEIFIGPTNRNSAALHYYLGMNLGQLARTKGIGALKLVRRMEVEFTRTRELDERFDFAGADRNLGLLYREAPSIGSIGNRAKARAHLKRAVDLAPDYPANRLNYIEGLLKWKDFEEAGRQLKALEAIWRSARERFAGSAWAKSWISWQKQLDDIRLQLKPQK
jgi:tetratricopeptide (TPR) repeat protein